MRTIGPWTGRKAKATERLKSKKPLHLYFRHFCCVKSILFLSRKFLCSRHLGNVIFLHGTNYLGLDCRLTILGKCIRGVVHDTSIIVFDAEGICHYCAGLLEIGLSACRNKSIYSITPLHRTNAQITRPNIAPIDRDETITIGTILFVHEATCVHQFMNNCADFAETARRL